MVKFELREEFTRLVRQNTKRQLIRQGNRRDGVKVGTTLEFFEISDGDNILIRSVTCTAVRKITIDKLNGVTIEGENIMDRTSNKGRTFAKDDGYKDMDELIADAVSKYGMPFVGVLIEW